MATRRRTSASKTAKSATKSIKESTISVKKVTSPPVKSVNKVTQIEEVNVTETADMIEINLPEGTNLKKRPMNVEKKVTRSLDKLDGLELILLPLVYLEGFVKLLISNQF